MSSQQQMQNDDINVTFSREPGCVVKLEIQVTPKACQAAHHKAIKNISKEVSVPGFRKGKAPEPFILKNFAPHVEKEWKELLLNTAINEAIRLIKIAPFNDKSMKSAKFTEVSKDGAVIQVEYEAFPTLPDIAFDKLNINEIQRRQVTEKDVKMAIDELLLRRAEWKEVEGRGVQPGDFVNIDIDIISEPARNVCTSTLFWVTPERMEGWMRRLIEGATPGATLEAMSEQDECHECEAGAPGHHHEEFKPAMCRIMLHNIKEAVMPPLDDEFAKAYGATSVEDLKTKIEERLNKQADEEQKNHRRGAIGNALLATHSFDIPLSLVADQIKAVHRKVIDSLRAEGVSEDKIEEEAKKAELAFAQKVEQEYRMHFLLQKIVHEQQIQLHDEDVMLQWMKETFYRQMSQQEKGIQQENQEDPEEAKARIRSNMLTEKALDFLLEKRALFS